MKMTTSQVPAGEFKAKCLRIMDQVKEKHMPIIITKRGIPIVKLVPIDEKQSPKIFGCLRGSVSIKADIIAPIEEKWEADE